LAPWEAAKATTKLHFGREWFWSHTPILTRGDGNAGHSQASLTLNTYSHVLPALQDDAASKMDAILSKA
jgi:hypothetical protein